MPLHNLLTTRKTDACPVILLSRVQPLKDRENLVGVLHVHAAVRADQSIRLKRF
jgi:hypothetical protein